LNYLACWSSCLYNTKKCLERSAKFSRKWSDGTSYISWFCSVSLFEWMKLQIEYSFWSVPQNLTIKDLRQHILDICGQDEEFPKEFIYLRSVGRCLTKVETISIKWTTSCILWFQVKPLQETDLRVKNYRPPTVRIPLDHII
jgi:hypothetical protein